MTTHSRAKLTCGLCGKKFMIQAQFDEHSCDERETSISPRFISGKNYNEVDTVTDYQNTSSEKSDAAPDNDNALNLKSFSDHDV